ncbi:Glutaredoxin domain-containing protein [Caenorhabditis elegans]|uniref:Glutaredoxin domain-containing protein n=1 Tax=Caenorhabditis elegans TaxID=6239 RepID=C7FZS8_CAEEL|nr:Glutaredoxin domain-containing protein [Caenorhabditis elegans]CCD68745.1 Glutaredoxin domain-containing protein [Caenorhabditis elegans]|eukprot:NP_001254099.1 Uncharacterized protein CELE_EEED8.18 [Caenorhabditis elegans]
MSAQPVGKSDMQTLRDENEVLRSLLVKKYTCPDCTSMKSLMEKIAEMEKKLDAETKQNALYRNQLTE